MGGFVEGDVVSVRFPYADKEEFKKRPAIVVATLHDDEYLLAAITSQCPRLTPYMSLTRREFDTGGLPVDPCYIRPGKLFTATADIILECKGRLKLPPLAQIRSMTRELFD